MLDKKVVFVRNVPRTLVALVLFIVLSAGSVGVVGFATAGEGPADLAVERLTLPPAREGDVVEYRQAEGTLDRLGAFRDPYRYQWESPRWTIDREGEFRLAYALTRSNSTSLTDVTLRDVESGQMVGRQWWSERVREPTSVFGGRFEQAVEETYPGMPLGPPDRPSCLLVWANASPLDLREPLSLPSCGDGGLGWAASTWRAVASTAREDHVEVVLERTSGKAHAPERVILRSNVPYPVGYLYDTSNTKATEVKIVAGGRQTVVVMTGYDPGDRPLFGRTYERPAPLPSLELAPLGEWGIPDEQDIDHPYPFSAAFRGLLEDPRDPSMREFLKDHPDAKVHSMMFYRQVVENTALLTWSWALSEGRWHYEGCYYATEDPAIGAIHPVELHGAVSACERGASYGEAVAEGPEEGPRVASLLDIWDRYRTFMGIEQSAPPFWSLTSSGRLQVGFAADTARDSARVSGEPTRRIETGSVLLDQNGTVFYTSRSDFQTQQPLPSPPQSTDRPEDLALRGVTFDAALWGAPSIAQAVGLTFLAFLIAVLYWAFPWLKHGFLTGFFSRVHRDAALDNQNRATIMAAIEAEPGVSDRELQRRVGLARGQYRHHRDKLLGVGLIVKKSSQGFTGYWTAGSPHGTAEERAALRSGTARQIVALLREAPQTSQTKIADRLGLSRQAVGKHVKRLRAAGLLPS